MRPKDTDSKDDQGSRPLTRKKERGRRVAPSVLDDPREAGAGRSRYADLYDFAPFGYLILNGEGVVREINVTGAHMMGMDRSDLIGKPIWSFVAPESRDLLRLCLVNALDAGTKQKCDITVTRNDGTVFHALLEARESLPDPSDKERLRWCVMTDITERKKAEEALRAALDFNRSLFVAAVDPFATVDLSGKITGLNPAFERISGYAKIELVGQDWTGCFAEPEKARMAHEAVLGNSPVKNYPLTLRHKLGHLTPVLCSAALYHNEKGKAAGIFAAAHDISERKRVEAERAQLAAVVEQADEIVVITDRNWRVTYVNPSFEKKTGYARQEIVGKGIGLLGGGMEGNMFYRPIRDALQRGQVWAGRSTARRKDGSTYEVDVSMSPIREESGGIGGYVAVARDITEQLKLEEQLRQSQKMEAIGTLAGGIAHDFNNILAGIIGFTEMALDDASDESAVAKNLRYVLKGGLRGRELVKQILAFSRAGAYEKRLLNAVPIIKEIAKLLRASLPSTVEMALQITSASDLIFADPSQIQQILVNLATNGAHAMGENGGVLQISITDYEVMPGSLPEPDMEPGEYLSIAVTDNGAGMSPETMSRIFEPFFTTKTAARGTGLGLAVVFGIVKSLGGSITVESEPGVGSTFRVLVPKGKPEMGRERTTGTSTLSGDERILFVDDEESLAEWAKAALERLGYRVTSMTDSIAALEAFLANPSAFDLIITDQTMPKMTGKLLARETLKARPDMPVILCTGHSEVVSPTTVEEEGIRELLMKPLSKRELAEAIRRVLDGEPDHP